MLSHNGIKVRGARLATEGMERINRDKRNHESIKYFV